jgi:hypothetical protein
MFSFNVLVRFWHSSNNSKDKSGSSSFLIISFNAVATAVAGTCNKRRSYDGSIGDRCRKFYSNKYSYPQWVY